MIPFILGVLLYDSLLHTSDTSRTRKSSIPIDFCRKISRKGNDLDGPLRIHTCRLRVSRKRGTSGRGSLRSHFKASHSKFSRSICFSDCIYSDDFANNGLSLISLFSFIHSPPHSTAGPRNCIGQRFALLEEKSIISAIVRKFKIKSVQKREDIKLLQEIVLRPLDGIHLQFQRRQ